MTLYHNHKGLFLGLGVLFVSLFCYTSAAFSTDDPSSPVVQYMTDQERKDLFVKKPPVVHYMTDQERKNLFDKKAKPKKLKVVNHEAKPIISKKAVKKVSPHKRAVRSCQSAVSSVLKDQPIEFLPGRHRLSRTSIEIVKDIAVILQDCERIKVIISGHTDSRGTPETNQRLSGLRASSVMQEFIKSGVKKERLRAVGLGDSSPIAPNDSPENEALNRRIELELY